MVLANDSAQAVFLFDGLGVMIRARVMISKLIGSSCNPSC